MNNEKISIVVPVYNVEQYIDQCITSLIGQLYTNLEILLVDDGSSDRSGNICDEYALKDSRIKVFHIKNSGQSTARNVGIDNATGEYIAFVDSDDYVDTDMYLMMIETANNKDAQIVECNFEGRHIKAPEQDSIDKSDYIEMSGEDAIKRQLDYRIESQYPGTALWPKMFRKDVIGDMRLPDGCIHEEFALLASAFLKADKYVYICETMYHRTIRDNSTTAMEFSDRAFDKLTVYRMRNELLKGKN